MKITWRRRRRRRRLFTICGLTTFLGFRVGIAGGTSGTIRELCTISATVLLFYGFKSAWNSWNGQRSRVFIIFSRNSRGSVACFIRSIQANLHMNYFLENTCCEACQAEEGYSGIEYATKWNNQLFSRTLRVGNINLRSCERTRRSKISSKVFNRVAFPRTTLIYRYITRIR